MKSAPFHFPSHAIPVALFTACYVVLFFCLALFRKNWEFVFYIPIVLLATLAIGYLANRCKYTTLLLWLLSIWGLLHVMGGVLQVPESWPIEGEKHSLYSWQFVPGILAYDKPVHAFGFGVATLACWQSLCAVCNSQRITIGKLILASLAGMGLGALNEVIEFIASQTMETNVGGYVNTGGDLIANLVGSLIALAWITLSASKNQLKTSSL